MTLSPLSVSVVIPTLNCARVLEKTLRSIADQDYPQSLIEIIVADGGSSDETIEVARKFGARIFENPLKTGEAGKAVAVKRATGQLVALIDSDNILPQKDWMSRMTAPFSEEEIIGSEPWEYTWRAEDGFITRYCALIGVNDPLVMFLGNYDRLNLLTGKWTELDIPQEDRGGYIVFPLNVGLLPTIGANGTLLRKSLIDQYPIGDYFFDIDFLYGCSKDHGEKFAKVKIGIIHSYCESTIPKFYRKQERRIRDFLFYEKTGLRKYPWRALSFESVRGRGLIVFIIYTLMVLPLIGQSIAGFRKRRDLAWFFHPLACTITLWVYGFNWIKKQVLPVTALDRKSYGQ